jgi:hypothetical protein
MHRVPWSSELRGIWGNLYLLGPRAAPREKGSEQRGVRREEGGAGSGGSVGG